jgi:hypothetical protein
MTDPDYADVPRKAPCPSCGAPEPPVEQPGKLHVTGPNTFGRIVEQLAEPAKVAAPSVAFNPAQGDAPARFWMSWCNAAMGVHLDTRLSGEWNASRLIPLEVVLASIHDATQAALAQAEASCASAREGWDKSQGNLAQAEAERDQAVRLLRELAARYCAPRSLTCLFLAKFDAKAKEKTT